jgi:hypothetical protein
VLTQHCQKVIDIKVREKPERAPINNILKDQIERNGGNIILRRIISQGGL